MFVIVGLGRGMRMDVLPINGKGEEWSIVGGWKGRGMRRIDD